MIIIFKNTKYIELNKTYRSSEEIINYSNKILGLNNAISIRKNNNEKVEEREYSISNIKKDIEVLKKKYNTIAIITEDLRSAKLVKKEFKDFELISSSKDTITNNIVIIPSYLSKGLEFDAVLIIKDDDIFDINKNLFYVSVTRAKSKLIVYKNKDINSFNIFNFTYIIIKLFSCLLLIFKFIFTIFIGFNYFFKLYWCIFDVISHNVLPFSYSESYI